MAQPQLSNSKAMYDAFIADVTTYGAAAGGGDTSLPSFAVRAAEACFDGLISPGQAGEIYKVFQDARSKRANKVYTKNSLSAQVSKLRRVLDVAAGLPDGDGPALIQRVIDIRATLADSDTYRDAIVGSLYDNIVFVCREQLKEGNMISGALTDVQIKGVIMPSKKEKEELAIIEAAWKGLVRISEGKKDDPSTAFPSARLNQAIDALLKRVVELGGPTETKKGKKGAAPHPQGNTPAPTQTYDEFVEEVAVATAVLEAEREVPEAGEVPPALQAIFDEMETMFPEPVPEIFTPAPPIAPAPSVVPAFLRPQPSLEPVAGDEPDDGAEPEFDPNAATTDDIQADLDALMSGAF